METKYFILIHIVFYFALIKLILYFLKRRFEKRDLKTEIIKKNIKRIKISAIIIFVIGFLYLLLFVATLSLDDAQYHGIRKYSYKYYAVISNSVVNNFPILEEKKKVEFYSRPSEISHNKWGLGYTSKGKFDEIAVKLSNYLRKNGFEFSDFETNNNPNYFCINTYDKMNKTQIILTIEKKDYGIVEVKFDLVEIF